MQKKNMQELERKSVEAFRNSRKSPVILILDNVRSMHNVGSVFRTADAFLAEGVFLCGYTPTPPHRDIQKTALGATETVHWQYFSKTLEAIAFVKAQGFAVYAVEQVKGSAMLQHFEPPTTQKLAVIFGNEVSGVSVEALQQCDGSIEIPQIGTKHSLNISVAAGIVLWELVRETIQAG